MSNSLVSRQLDRNKHREMLVKNLGIFELRALGRELGVSSPTTKRRDELVDCILDRIYSDEPVMKTSKMGRPYKKLSSLQDIMSQMAGDEPAEESVKPLKYEQVVVFSQNVPVFSDVLDENRELSGVLHTSETVAYFNDYKAKAKVFVPSEVVDNYNLDEGDFIKAEAKKINSRDQYLLTDVLKLNFVEPKKNDVIAQGQEAIISKETLDYGSFKLFCGRRNLILYKNNLFEDERFAQFSRFCKDNDYVLITLGLNTSFEDQIMFSGIRNLINLTTEYGSESEEGFNKVVDAISLAQRLIEIGKKCVVFISDIVEVLNVLDECFADNSVSSPHKQKSLIIIKKLISLGRAYANGSSLTLVMTYRENDKDDEFLSNELKKICSEFN